MAGSPTICYGSPLATVFSWSSRQDLLEIQCATCSTFGRCVATCYLLLYGFSEAKRGRRVNVAESDVCGGCRVRGCSWSVCTFASLEALDSGLR